MRNRRNRRRRNAIQMEVRRESNPYEFWDGVREQIREFYRRGEHRDFLSRDAENELVGAAKAASDLAEGLMSGKIEPVDQVFYDLVMEVSDGLGMAAYEVAQDHDLENVSNSRRGTPEFAFRQLEDWEHGVENEMREQVKRHERGETEYVYEASRTKQSADVRRKIEQEAEKAAEEDQRAGVGPVDDPLDLMGHLDAFKDLLQSIPEVREWARQEDEYVIYYPVDRYGEAVDVYRDAYHEAHRNQREAADNPCGDGYEMDGMCEDEDGNKVPKCVEKESRRKRAYGGDWTYGGSLFRSKHKAILAAVEGWMTLGQYSDAPVTESELEMLQDRIGMGVKRFQGDRTGRKPSLEDLRQVPSKDELRDILEDEFGVRTAGRDLCASCRHKAAGQVHDLDYTGIRNPGDEFYADTQTDGSISDGDIMKVRTDKGTATVLMNRAWPVQIAGDVVLDGIHFFRSVADAEHQIEQNYPDAERHVDWDFVRRHR